eukprot:1158908-Pelagomonas_calceolata.AAC.1
MITKVLLSLYANFMLEKASYHNLGTTESAIESKRCDCDTSDDLRRVFNSKASICHNLMSSDPPDHH